MVRLRVLSPQRGQNTLVQGKATLASIAAAKMLNLPHPIVTDIEVPEGVWARAVPCSEKGIILSMVNDHVVRQAETEQIDVSGGRKTQIRKDDIIGYKDLGPFDVTLELPAWLKPQSIALVTPEGLKPLQFSQDQTRLTCKNVAIGAGAMVMIKR